MLCRTNPAAQQDHAPDMSGQSLKQPWSNNRFPPLQACRSFPKVVFAGAVPGIVGPVA